MDPNRLTEKSQEALQAAQEQARARNQQMAEPAHILFALLSDPEGVVYPVLHRLEQSPRTLRDRTEELLNRVPYSRRGMAGFYQGMLQLEAGVAKLTDAGRARMEALRQNYGVIEQ